MLRRILVVLLFAFLSSPAVAGNVLITVDIQMQTMHVRVDGETMYRWDVSTGRAGYDTPPGRYQPTRMHKKYFSRKYDNAPMPFSIFFYEGYAIHGTGDLKNLGRVASHGCVRLDPDNASMLFDLVKQIGPENTVIRVQSHRAADTAVLTDPVIPEGEVVEATAEVDPEDVDALTTGSISVQWLRRGLDG
jgi:hypothetical protein